MPTRSAIARRFVLSILAILIAVSAFSAPLPIGTAFTYQGRLAENGTGYTGTADFEFELYDNDGVSVAGPITRTGVAVSGGLFKTDLDFGDVFNGQKRFLEIRVKTTGPTYTTLTPRQELTPTPYAVYATNAGTAATATNADQLDGNDSTAFALSSHSHPASTISGVPTGEVVYGAGGTALTSEPQFTYDSANNNLSVANDIGAGGVYRINGASVLRVVPAADNTFVGLSGNATATGTANTSVGENALVALTSGNSNTALGARALAANTHGPFNTAIGAGALDELVPALATGQSGNNTAVGSNALGKATVANDNTAVGADALAVSTASANSAFGSQSLLANTTGGNNTAIGAGTLHGNTTGSQNIAIGTAALFNNNGSDNVAMGFLALFNTSSGAGNTALGTSTMNANTTGARNVAVGQYALDAVTTANDNTAIGYEALSNLTLGADSNTAVGMRALFSNTVGFRNTALGQAAGSVNTGGSDNIYIGRSAGSSHTSNESNNILIGNPGSSGDSGLIRIGSNATHTNTRIAGINGRTITGNPANITLVDANGQLGTAGSDVRLGSVFGVPVTGGASLLINASGQLGTVVSSGRYKEEVRDMGAAADQLLRLRPVVFKYRPELTPDRTDQFGLIAEEVAAVNPDWVIHDSSGTIASVRYDQVNAALLGLVQRQNQEIQGLQQQIDALAAALARIEAEKKQ